MTNIASHYSKDTGLMYQKTKSDPAWDLWAETLAPYEAALQTYLEQANPTCRDIFLQWRRDVNPGGFSAKIFLHLTSWTSMQGSQCSDIIALLSKWTPRRLRVKEGVVSSWQDSISKKYLIGSSERALTPKAIRGMARRGARWNRRYDVLVRDQAHVIIATCLFTRGKSGAYVCSHRMSGSLFKDSLLDGMTEHLNQLVNESRETQ